MSETKTRRRRRRSSRSLEPTVETDVSLETVHELWDVMHDDPTMALYWSDYSAPDFLTFARQLGQEYLLLVGRLQGALAGGVLLSQETAFPTTRRPMHCVVDLYILQEFRGQPGLALARAFHRHIVETMGFHQYLATVRVENTVCQHFVTAAGMQRVGLVPRYLPVGGVLQDVVLYVGQGTQGGSHG